MKNKWKLGFCCGWYKGNVPVFLKISIFEPLEDYSAGWIAIQLIGIMFAKIEMGIWLNNKGR